MTARRHADYVYRNKRDSLRVRLHRRENGRWDYDVFQPSGAIATYSDEAGDDFATKRDALAAATAQHGPLRAIAVQGNVVDDAWRSRASRVHGAAKKTPSQLDREIAETLAKYASTPEPGSYGSEDEGVFYLTDTREQPLGPEFRSRLAAKRAARKLVREGTHPRVEVWHRWRGDRYMQGLASEEGWSDV
jgi:hypothetical protein